MDVELKKKEVEEGNLPTTVCHHDRPAYDDEQRQGHRLSKRDKSTLRWVRANVYECIVCAVQWFAVLPNECYHVHPSLGPSTLLRHRGSTETTFVATCLVCKRDWVGVTPDGDLVEVVRER